MTASLWLDRTDAVAGDPLPVGERVDVVVVGAGLTGLVTAVMLARHGQAVVVIEARTVGAVTTGNTTGKLSLLQGTHLSSVLSAHSRWVAAAYVDGNRAGMDWLLQFCAASQVPVQRRDAITYATDQRSVRQVRAEYRAARMLGLAPRWEAGFEELPYPTAGGVLVSDQAQFDPIQVLAALAAEARSLGVRIVQQQRVSGVRTHRIGLLAVQRVQTPAGALDADQVVLASGVPFLDRGLYFAKTTPQRSYAAAYAVPGPIPDAMYLSSGEPSRSLRTAPQGGSELLLVGGNGHVVGRNRGDTSALVADLDDWTSRWFPGARRTHVWSAQDYASANHVPFVGKLPGGHGRIWLATGYSKWGMSNAAMAALMITTGMLGGRPSWAGTLQRRVTKPTALIAGARNNTVVGAQAAAGWLNVELNPNAGGVPEPADGHGATGRDGVNPVAVSVVDGATCTVSAICTHLGGILRYNDQEQSWDCPLHGSRFAADGTVLEGPAVQPLKPVEPAQPTRSTGPAA